jgi:hypothetical protein
MLKNVHTRVKHRDVSVLPRGTGFPSVRNNIRGCIHDLYLVHFQNGLNGWQTPSKSRSIGCSKSNFDVANLNDHLAQNLSRTRTRTGDETRTPVPYVLVETPPSLFSCADK